MKEGTSEWVTVVYLPFLRPRHGAAAKEKKLLRMRRDAVLQRCMALLLDRLTYASKHGDKITIATLGIYTAFPRVTLYASDLPEKRHLQGLRLNMCEKPFSLCLVGKEECGLPRTGMARGARDVTENLEIQLEAACLFDEGTGEKRLDQISRDYSALPFVPALGAIDGLGTGSKSLYNIFGFDLLHVRSVRTGGGARSI